jgi:hypothetical protein
MPLHSERSSRHRWPRSPARRRREPIWLVQIKQVKQPKLTSAPVSFVKVLVTSGKRDTATRSDRSCVSRNFEKRSPSRRSSRPPWRIARSTVQKGSVTRIAPVGEVTPHRRRSRRRSHSPTRPPVSPARLRVRVRRAASVHERGQESKRTTSNRTGPRLRHPTRDGFRMLIRCPIEITRSRS